MRGRPPKFEVEQALDGAVEVFRRKGFDGTSMKDLTVAMGMGSQSIYNAFGNKAEVFSRALNRYADQSVGPFSHLHHHGSLDDIRGILRGALVQIELEAPLCMVLRTVTDKDSMCRDGVLACTQTHLERLEWAFQGVLDRAVAADELVCDDTVLLAKYLHMCLQGLVFVAHAGATPEELEHLVDFALQSVG